MLRDRGLWVGEEINKIFIASFIVYPFAAIFIKEVSHEGYSYGMGKTVCQHGDPAVIIFYILVFTYPHPYMLYR